MPARHGRQWRWEDEPPARRLRAALSRIGAAALERPGRACGSAWLPCRTHLYRSRAPAESGPERTGEPALLDRHPPPRRADAARGGAAARGGRGVERATRAHPVRGPEAARRARRAVARPGAAVAAR